MNELKNIIIKNAERSEIDKLYLFSMKKMEKSKIFMWCYRFLLNAYNLLEDGDLKNEIKRELDLCGKRYSDVNYYLEQYNLLEYNKHRFGIKLQSLLNDDKIVDNLIDVFSILLEKVNIISISRFKGVILDGSSEKEWKPIMGSIES